MRTVSLRQPTLRPKALGIMVGSGLIKSGRVPTAQRSLSFQFRPAVAIRSTPIVGVWVRMGRHYYSTDLKEKKIDQTEASKDTKTQNPSTSSVDPSKKIDNSDIKFDTRVPAKEKDAGFSPAPTPPLPVEDAPKKSLWEKIKHEAQHYWDGTKLLGYEIKVSTKLLAKMAAGYELTRRENRQLKRTTQDLVRLVPFSMFILVPFAELLLPFALKLFPNLLPSTYESGAEREKKNKKLRKTRGSVSNFLKQTVNESGMVFPVVTSPEQKEQFAEFFVKVRSNVETPSHEMLVNVARMFKDDVVLDNLSRPQLVAMAKYINIHPYGTNVMLRYSIRHRMRQIKRDDRAIDYEGIESLSNKELSSACAARGISTHKVSPGKLREEIGTWLELRLHQKVPSTLLVLASAYTYGEKNIESYYDGLLAVLSALPEELFHEAELEISAKEATNKQRLEVLKEQDELIQEENKEEERSGHKISVRDEQNIEDDHDHAHEQKKSPDALVEKKKHGESEPQITDKANSSEKK